MGVFEIKGGPITHKYLMRKTKDDLACELLRELKERLKAEAKNKELEAERQRDALDGQAALDEANNRIKELEARYDQLKQTYDSNNECLEYNAKELHKAEAKNKELEARIDAALAISCNEECFCLDEVQEVLKKGE